MRENIEPNEASLQKAVTVIGRVRDELIRVIDSAIDTIDGANSGCPECIADREKAVKAGVESYFRCNKHKAAVRKLQDLRHELTKERGFSGGEICKEIMADIDPA